MYSGRFVRCFDNGRTDKSNLEYGTRTGYEFLDGKGCLRLFSAV